MTSPTSTSTSATDDVPRGRSGTRTRGTRRRRAGWLTMTVLATLTAAFAARYFADDPALFLAQQRAVYVANLAPLLFHISGGVLALTLGPWQFLPGLRRRHPALHRTIGRVYLVGAVAAGTGGLLMVPKALFWPVAPLGFAALAVALLGASTMAFAAIRRGAVTEHRVWMIRSYALIFGAVSFRLWLVLLPGLGLPFDQAYRTGAWLSWLVDLLVAQRLVSRIRNRRSGP
ncbi:DUF2306 domain-containing protein [Streptacidiphilus sp. P02-A3a]|uniref:DUF2306 domain-containing protein n=1 Tax=Streptacidiphilus sp. P02-A3a TaxID=2704468 RepID=UPI0015F84A82|nr:DUF2306 domain-containing protein [Streptacidiphilus sp. P02-A3a]QMU69843.1 DUF2306 domain-containing protein [Streptacidiphilus sp. P02-A3a]